MVVAGLSCGGDGPTKSTDPGGGQSNSGANTPASLVKVDGDGQSAPAGATVATVPSVKVTNSSNKPLSNIDVTWAVTVGGGSILGQVKVPTGSDGVSRVGGWRLGTAPGTNQITATVSGVTPATFSATGMSTTVSIVKVSGDTQKAPAGYPPDKPLVVKVVDNRSGVMSGVTVIWKVETGGGSTAAPYSVTDADGLALTTWTLGRVGGAQTVSATIDGRSVSFSATSELLRPEVAQFDPNVLSMDMSGIGSSIDATLTLWDSSGQVIVYGVPVDIEITNEIANLEAIGSGDSSAAPLGVSDVGTVQATQRVRLTGTGPRASTAPCAATDFAPLRVRAMVAQCARSVRSGDRIRIRGKAQGQSPLKVFDVSSTSPRLIESNVETIDVRDPIKRVAIDLSDTAFVVFQGDTIYVRALTYDASGAEMPYAWFGGGHRTFEWFHTDAGGAISIVGCPGSSCLTQDTSIAVIGGLSGRARLSVRAARAPSIVPTPDLASAAVDVFVVFPRVVAVNLTPTNPTLRVGDSLRLTATILGGNGKVLTQMSQDGCSPCSRTVTWRSLNPTIATVSDSGTVTAVSPGTAVIVATADGVEGRSTATVPAITFAKLVSPSCALNEAGSLYCWYRAASPSDYPLPTPVAAGRSFASAVGGGQYASLQNQSWCGNDASGATMCWGANERGQLGDGTRSGHTDPRPVAGNYHFPTLASGGTAMCGITASGALYCWGDLQGTGAGSGTAAQSDLVPVRTGPDGVVFTSVAVESSHACAVTSNLELYCWGYNSSGELGPRPDAHSGADDHVPMRVDLRSAFNNPISISAVAVGAGFTCVLIGARNPSSGNDAGCLGSNVDYRLGHSHCSTSGASCAFDPVNGVLSFSFLSLSATGSTTCGITTAASVVCWGGNGSLQAGDASGAAGSVAHVVSVPGAPRALAAGFVHTCVLVSGPKVYCWGDTRSMGVFPAPANLYTAVPTPVASQP